MKIYKPSVARIRWYYFFRSLSMALGSEIGILIGSYITHSQLKLSFAGALFIGNFVMIIILHLLLDGATPDELSIVFTDSSITGRSIGIQPIERVTIHFEEILKVTAQRKRWLNPNKIVGKNNQTIFIHPALSDEDYNQIISTLKEKGF